MESEPKVTLTPRQWEFYRALLDRRTTADIEAGRGIPTPMARQQQHRYLKMLQELGCITASHSNPANEHVTDDYPWVPTDLVPTVRGRTPRGARLREVFPVESAARMTVTPIRIVIWPTEPVEGVRRWSVQGDPMFPPDGRGPRHALPTHRVVVVANLTTGGKWDMFPAPLPARCHADRNPLWSERLTTQHVTADPPLTPAECRQLTLMIAAVIGEEGTDALHESPTEGHHG